MRRNDREVTNKEEIIDIIRRCDVCSVAMFDEEYPYLIPLNFGFCANDTSWCLYFHGANEGKKIDLMKKNANVAFEMNCAHTLIHADRACQYTMHYESVCGRGVISMVEKDEKLHALTMLMKQYVDDDHAFSSEQAKGITILKLSIQNISAKRSI